MAENPRLTKPPDALTATVARPPTATPQSSSGVNVVAHPTLTIVAHDPAKSAANPMTISGTGLRRTGMSAAIVGGSAKAGAGVLNGTSLQRK